jgi:hypothetical protein
LKVTLSLLSGSIAPPQLLSQNLDRAQAQRAWVSQGIIDRQPDSVVDDIQDSIPSHSCSSDGNTFGYNLWAQLGHRPWLNWASERSKM